MQVRTMSQNEYVFISLGMYKKITAGKRLTGWGVGDLAVGLDVGDDYYERTNEGRKERECK